MPKLVYSRLRRFACLGALLLGVPLMAGAQSLTSPPGGHLTRPRPAFRTSGAVLGWGLNSSGQLGNNLTTNSATPSPVLGAGGSGYLTNVTSVAVGADFTLALKSDGTVWAWGDNSGGELGIGNTTNSSTPVQVLNLTDITAIAVGDNQGIALKSDGTVWGWGEDDDGEIGNGEMGTDVRTPTQALGPGGSGFLTGITQIAASDYTVVALRSDGTVWAWGANTYGELGNGNTTSSSVPAQVLGPGGSGFLTGITAVTLTYYTTLALRSDGTVWAWGDNNVGQLGNGTMTSSSTPVQALGAGGSGFLTNVTTIAALEYNSYAVKADGTVWVWGHNYTGELGNGTASTTNSAVPVQVLGPGGVGYLTGITAILPIYDGSVALGNDGTVWAWGWNGGGQLGHAPGTNGDVNGGFGEYNTLPTQVLGPNGTGFLTGITQIAPNFANCFALRNDGTVWAWGDNTDGQLGIGSTASYSSFPTQVAGLTGATALFAGANDTFAISDVEAVSGNIVLQGEVSAAPSQTLNLTFTSTTGGATYTFAPTIGPSGAFTLPAIPTGSYTLAIKGSKWLRKDIAVDTTSGPVTNINVTLLAGDINNDNVIDLRDFNLLATTFGSTSTSAKWNANADLNGDGVVDLRDFNLLAGNFGKAGDP